MAKAKDELGLIVVEELKADILCTEQGLDETLDKIKNIAKSFVYDSTTDQGRAEIKSLAYKVACSKKPIITVLKKESEEASLKVKRINGLCGKVEDKLDALRDEIRKPVTDYEAEQERIRQENIKKEEERVTGIREKMSNLSAYGIINYNETAESLTNRIKTLNEYIIDDTFAEFKDEAGQIKITVFNQLNNALIKRQAYEKEQAEQAAEKARLAQVAKEQAEAQAKIDAENARIAAEQKAEADRLKAIQAEIDRKEAALKAETDRKEREAKEAQIREEARLKAIKEAEEKAIRDQKEKEARELAEKKKAEEKAAMAPDKEKLMKYAESLRMLKCDTLKSEEAMDILTEANGHIIDAIECLLTKSGAL